MGPLSLSSLIADKLQTELVFSLVRYTAAVWDLTRVDASEPVGSTAPLSPTPRRVPGGKESRCVDEHTHTRVIYYNMLIAD